MGTQIWILENANHAIKLNMFGLAKSVSGAIACTYTYSPSHATHAGIFAFQKCEHVCTTLFNTDSSKINFYT